ncbi:sigma-70 family RNA polymerase sigma factor [Streptomyces sp. NPDC048506]|uniref:sigma-70 family RNA polymerase sigma factor n=1 Tax=Streptomyces sp. NPDC048506 TaxID=3155028 RepID=UPI00343F64CD
MWGIDEELRMSRLLSGSTDGGSPTVRQICTFCATSWHCRRSVDLPAAAHAWPSWRHKARPGRIGRNTHRASPALRHALRDKAVHLRDDRLMPWSSRKRGGPRTDPNRSAHRVSGRGALSTADEELLRTLYAEHSGALFHYVLRLTSGDWQWAEDVVQETLLRAWQHPAAFDPARGPARAWLCTVARHLVIDAHRARQARPAEAGGEALQRAAEQTPGEDQIEQALQSWAVAEAVRSLSPDHRAVLLETYYRGRTMAEAAQVLGIPLGTVKSRTHYALHALRLALQERGIEP